MKKSDTKSTPVPTQEKPMRAWGFLLILIVVSLCVYWQTTDFDMVWDDNGIHLISNPYLNPPGSEDLLHFWEEPYEGLYIPLAYNAWGILNIWGSSLHHDPFVYHFANVLLHILNGLLVFALLKFFLKNPWASMAGSLVFLLHPIQAESVSWISEFRGLLATFLGFSALLLYLRSLDTRYGTKKEIWPAPVSTLLFGLALLSKPSVVILPLFALSIEYFRHRPSRKQLTSPSWLWLWIGFSGAITVITSSAQEGLHSYPFWAKPLVWMDATTFYLYKLFLPLDLAATYSRTPQSVMEQWWFYVLWIIPVSLGTGLWYVRKKYPLLVLSALLFMLGFLPVSGLKEFHFQTWSTVADRYLYLSMLGVALGVGYGINQLRGKWTWTWIGAAILFLGIRTFTVQVPTWKNTLTLWTRSVEVTPESHYAQNNRGAAYNNRSEFTKALSDLNQALTLNPEYTDAYINRGISYSSMGESKKALSDFQEAISRNPDSVTAYNNRGLVYDKLGEYEKAIADYTRAIELKPENAQAYYNRGNALNNQKEYAEAITNFNKALSLHPGYVEAYQNRGVAHLFRKEYDKAIQNYTKAIQIRPTHFKAWHARGIAHFYKKEYASALQDFSRAIEINPSFSDAYLKRATTHFYSKEYALALSDLEEAQRLGITVDPAFLSNVKRLAAP